MDAEPAKRNILGVLEANPQMAADGVRLRQIGQQIIQLFAGKRIHPAWVVPGGVNQALTEDKRDLMLSMLPEAYEITERTLVWFKGVLEKYQEEIRTFANFPSMFLGLVNDQGNLEHVDGRLRFIDSKGKFLADNVDPARYQDYIGEAVEPSSYLNHRTIRKRDIPTESTKWDRLPVSTCARAAERLARIWNGLSSSDWIAAR